MPHFRVDDALHSHPKARQAGLEAMGLWNLCGSYCMGYLTDGFVPEWYVKTWPKGVVLAKRLVAAKMWTLSEKDGEKGWQFHEFTGPGRNDSREQIEESRERWRKKKAGQRRDSPQVSPGDTPGDTSGDTTGIVTEVTSVLSGTNVLIERYNDGYNGVKPRQSAHASVPQSGHPEPCPTSMNTQMSPGDTRGESPQGSSRATRDPTQPNNKSSSGHPRDDSHESNAPEPPYDPGAEPERNGQIVIVDDAPTAIDNPPKPQRRHPSSAAKTVVRQTLGTQGLATYPRTFLDRLANQVDALYAEDHPDDLIRQALTEWDKRTDARPEWLHSVYGDIVKNTRAQPRHNGSTIDDKVGGWLQLANTNRTELT